MEALFKLHRDIPREGPGSDEATREALRRLPPLPERPRVFDMGCGPGRQTLVLARELDAEIVAVDFHGPYLEHLRRDASAAGLADRVVTRHVSFDALDDPPGSVDLIWAEGSIFILGFGAGLRRWRPLLRDGGLLVASELTWLDDDPPAEVRDYFEQEYPPMTTIAGNVRIAGGAGFEVFDHFVLPSQAWWEEYLTPLGARIPLLRPAARDDPDLAQILDDAEREMDICRRFADHFGYVFYLMRPV